MNDFKINSTIDLKTLYNICLRTYFKRRSLFIIFIPFVFVQVLTLTEGPVSWSDESWLLGVFGAMYIFIPILLYLTCKSQMQRTPYLKESLTYIINEDKIEITGESFSSTTNWQYVNMLMERERYFLIYNLNRSFYHLSKDGFESKEAAAAFKNMVKEKGIKFSYN